MARSFHSSTTSSTPSLTSESQNSNREPQLEIHPDEFDDDDRNGLVQCDHLQMQSKNF